MLPAILGLSGPCLQEEEALFFREAQPAGFILFGRNIVDPDQLRRLTDSLRDLTGRADLPLLIDQEGGAVARLRPPHWPALPGAPLFGRLFQQAPITAIEAARAQGQVIGALLAGSGISFGCLPVLDLFRAEGHESIAGRTFSPDPIAVASLGRAVAEALVSSGICPILKHMPGHGRAPSDSHHGLPVVAADAEALEADLEPFRRLRSFPAAMVAHLLFPAWDAERPASLSPRVIGDVIRRRIGFEGLLLSDDVGMGALSGSITERSRAVLEGGCDLALVGAGDLAQSRRLAGDLPSITPEARARLRTAAAGRAEAVVDWREAAARRDALLAVIEG